MWLHILKWQNLLLSPGLVCARGESLTGICTTRSAARHWHMNYTLCCNALAFVPHGLLQCTGIHARWCDDFFHGDHNVCVEIVISSA